MVPPLPQNKQTKHHKPKTKQKSNKKTHTVRKQSVVKATYTWMCAKFRLLSLSKDMSMKIDCQAFTDLSIETDDWRYGVNKDNLRVWPIFHSMAFTQSKLKVIIIQEN